MRIKQTIGNTELWQREKTLFLTSRMAPFACYESVFHWVDMFDKQRCLRHCWCAKYQRYWL